MYKITFFITCICFLWACGSEQPNPESQENTNSTENISSTENNPIDPNAPLTEMPLIATYANELGIGNFFQKSETGTEQKIIFNGGDLTLENIDFDEDIHYNAANNWLRAGEGWQGTSGSEDWSNYYILLEEGDQPVVAVIAEHKSTARDGSSYREDLHEMIEEDGIPEKIAEKMLERDATIGLGYDFPFSYSDYTINMSILQKQNGSWADITKKAFPQDFGDKLKQFFPLFITSPESPSNLTMASISTPFMNGNKTIFDTWFTDEYKSLGVEPVKKEIHFKTGENSAAILGWNGEQLTYKDFPATALNFEQGACSQIDFASGKNYTFKGKIGTEHEIQMDVKFSITKAGDQPTVRMKGDYFYVGKGTKMPIEGEFSTKLGEPTRFYRTKKGKKREEFAAHFTSCEMKGWWQHLERLDIEEFTLKLVE